MAPRPILKGRLPPPDLSLVSSEAASNPLPFSSCSTILDSPHVHFPPTPTLTSTEITHSPFIYDRAPIVVSPNACALPERGGRKFVANNSKGGVGYFHPRAKFQVDAVRVERDGSELASSTVFSASGTVRNVNDSGLFMKKQQSGPMYDYEYDYDQYPSHDQCTQHAQHVILPLLFDCSPDPSDLGILCSPPSRYAPLSPTSSSSSSSSSISISHSSVNLSTRNMYNNTTLTAPPSPSSAAGNLDNNDVYPGNQFIPHHHHTHIGGVHDAPGYYSSSSTTKQSAIPLYQAASSVKLNDQLDKKKGLGDVEGKRRRKSHDRAEGERGSGSGRVGTQRTMLLRRQNSDASREFELEGCLGGF